MLLFVVCNEAVESKLAAVESKLAAVESKLAKLEASRTVMSVTWKKSPNVYKSCPKIIFTREIKEFDTFTKIASKCWWFLPNNCCHRLWKIAQSAKNSLISSHWQWYSFQRWVFSGLTFKRCATSLPFLLGTRMTSCDGLANKNMLGLLLNKASA